MQAATYGPAQVAARARSGPFPALCGEPFLGRPRGRIRPCSTPRPREGSCPTGPGSATTASGPASSRTRAASGPTATATRPWTMRQYAGFGSAEETNERFRLLLERGQTGLSVAFDLPTQLGLDSDDVRALRRGRPHRRRDRLARRHAAAVRRHPARRGLDLDDDQRARPRCCCCSTSSPAEEQGVAPEDLRGTIQNDVLKEYAARGNYIFPPRPSMRLTVDIFRYCRERLPRFNTISISGYHIREAGSSAAQELGLHARQRHRLRRGGGRRRARGRSSSPRACRSSSTPTTTCSSRWPSSAPPAGCGRGSCATASGRATSAR